MRLARILTPECNGYPRRDIRESFSSFSSFSSLIDRFQPLRRESSRPTGDAVLPPPADDCVQVWILQTLSAVVSRFRGQNTILLCLHVRRSGLCYQPDPPVLPTGSVVRISTTLLEGSFTSASVIASSHHSILMNLLSEGLGDTELGDLLRTDGNPTSGLLPLLIQPFVAAGCRRVVPSPFSAHRLA